MWGAENLVSVVGGTRALESVSVEIPRGEITAVVGGDGAGKSTLLRVLVGRVAASEGTVDVPSLADIGYQPSTSGVWGELSVDENIDFVGRAYGMTPARLRERRDDLLRRAELTDARGRLASRLSGGMRQKLGFVLAILHEPRLVLLDEPSTGVDPVSRVELWRLIAEAAAGGAAVLMTTTYLDEAERAGRVLVLDAGHSLGFGEPASIIASVPGAITETNANQQNIGNSWRRGIVRHSWSPSHATSAGRPLVPDLEDAIIALTLARAAETALPEHVASKGTMPEHAAPVHEGRHRG